MKYVICVPWGGMNDVFCQIYRCLDYCKKHNRILVIDSKGCTVDFNSMIDLNVPGIQIVAEISNIQEDISNLTVFPLEFKANDIKTYNAGNQFWDKEFCMPRLTKYPKVITTFDFNKHYCEDILFHMNCGGGNLSNKLCDYIKFKDFVIKSFKDRYSKIRKPYMGIHIRNTDLKSELPEFMEVLKITNLTDNIFLATDDFNTILNFKQLYVDKIMNFSKVIPTNSPALHFNSAIPKLERNVDAVLDLLCLAYSEHIFHPIQKNNGNRYLSGFTMLALYLNRNKKIVNQMLGEKIYD